MLDFSSKSDEMKDISSFLGISDINHNQSLSNHSQEPCEWFGHGLQVLFVKLEQISHLKVESCLDFGHVRLCSGQGQFTLVDVI